MKDNRIPDVTLDDKDFMKSVELLAKHWGVSPETAVKRAAIKGSKEIIKQTARAE